MKTIVRNFISVLRRFKVATFLNIMGLAVAFAAFIIILIQVNYERRFDTCHPTAERVFRLDLTGGGTFSVILPRAFIEAFLQSSPHIETGSLIYPFLGEIYFTVLQNGEKNGFKEVVQTCHPALPEVFDFPIVEGEKNCLEDPEKVMIPQSLAKKLYGEGPAVGKALLAEEKIWTKDLTDLTVGAVYRDFPGNTQLRNVIYTAIDPNFALTNFGASNYVCYVLLDDASLAAEVADNFNRHFDYSKIGQTGERATLLPLTDIYYRNESRDGMIFRSGNAETTHLLFCIALLVIIVAGINFTNFSTALTPLRIKSVNTQKVLGSSDTVLRGAFLAEAVIISMFAWLLSLLIVWMLAEAALLPFIDANVQIAAHLPLVLLSGLVALGTGMVAGLYPSWYITSFPPALVLKGSFGLSASGRKLRTALIGFQFIVSILLIISSGFIRLQNDYMRKFSLGFEKDQVAIVELSGDIYNKHQDSYVNKLKQFPGIEEVAFAQEKVGSKDSYNTNSTVHKGKEIQYFLILCSPSFLQVMGIPVVDGRDFSLSDKQSESPVCIFNKAAREEGQMEVGGMLEGWPSRANIVGFTDDVKFTSLRLANNNIAFVTGRLDYTLPVSYIRLKAGTDVQAAVSHIRATLADIDPSYPFDIEFYDTIFDHLYHKEENFRLMIALFSGLAIFISLVGVFGLVVFDTQYRKKEIGIRKVHGAAVTEILNMFNKSYLKIVTVCFVIAAPIAWYGVKRWLESFVYKTPVYWWVFAVAFLIVCSITLLTVTFQNWKAANANPVDSIKSE